MRLLRFFILLVCLPALAVDRITISLTVTNGTTNGMTFVLNGSTRTFTNNVQASSVQVLTNSAATGTKTNLYNQVALNPFSQVSILNQGATNIDFVGASGLAMSASVSGFWGFVTYSTQTVSSMTAVRVPVSGEATAAVRTNIGSALVAGIEAFSTNALDQTSTAASELVGLTNAQTITGEKVFTHADSEWWGMVNSASLSGTAGYVTNGLFKTNIFAYPTFTNGVNYGLAFRSPGSGSASEQIGTGAGAVGDSSVAFGNGAAANTNSATAIGNSASVGARNGTAVGTSTIIGADGHRATALGSGADASYTNSTALGANAAATQPFQVRLGTATESVSIPGNLHVIGSSTNNTMRGTNVFPAGADVSFGRYAITTLADGANSVSVGTNVFIQVSGPSSAFSINGMDAQPNRDGAFRIILNLTGQNMTIAHDSGTEPTAANRIYTMTGSDHATTGNGSAMLIYSASASRWILLNLQE